MQLLLLMRHAHAVAPGGFAAGGGTGVATDFDRPLSDRGRAEADAAGDRLAAAGFAPDVILASAAVRTAETARRVAARLPAAPPVQLMQQLYGGTPADHRAALATCGDAATVLLVAHNPGVAEHLELLSGDRFPVPPATWAALEVDVTAWPDMNGSTRAEATRVDSP